MYSEGRTGGECFVLLCYVVVYLCMCVVLYIVHCIQLCTVFICACHIFLFLHVSQQNVPV